MTSVYLIANIRLIQGANEQIKTATKQIKTATNKRKDSN